MNWQDTIVETRFRRLLFSVLVPPFAGSLILLLVDLAGAENYSLELRVVLAIFMFSYVFMGLQSLAAGLIMEFVVLRFAVKSDQVLVAGLVLGALAGTTLVWMTPVFVIVGAGVGLIIGWVYRRCL